jgi:hypothetical protein
VTVSSFNYLLGSVPVFASRAFLASFLTALLARFGTSWEFLARNDVIQGLSHAPEWFKSDTALLVLFALAVLEGLSTKVPEVRAFLDEFDAWVKSATTLLVSLALVSGDSAKVLQTIEHQSLFSFGSLLSFGLAAAVWVLSQCRRAILGLIYELDDHDHLGLQSLLNWVEELGTLILLLFLVILPLAAIFLSALVSFLIWRGRKRAQRREREMRVPCAACKVPIHASAVRCSACGHAVEAPRKIGLFGQPKEGPAPEPEQHRFELVLRKRCPSCAKFLKLRTPRQACEECGAVTFADRASAESYLARLEQRLPKTLLVSLGLSAIPLLGIVPGVLYYRLTLISGLRGYIPPLKGCLTRMLVRWVNWGIIVLQWIPLVGAVVLPLMCWTNFVIYRRALRHAVRAQYGAR